MKSVYDRRSFLRALGALAVAPATAIPVRATTPRFTDYPFTLGVASGSPLPDSVVIWTRLAPDPLRGGGLDLLAVPVRWEMATDEAFSKIVQRGNYPADSTYGHSVHVEVRGLRPDYWYFYRFIVDDAVSPVGRTRTAPTPGSLSSRRFAFASCQQYEQGYYAAHRHMAAEDIDFVVFLGDYIYESSWGKRRLRSHEAAEPHTLAEYRNRYALYKTDPDLQLCHAHCPWIVTWDDHEVDNDYAADRAEDLDPAFLVRRAAAYRAYYEHMPLRAANRPRGPHMRLYRHYDFGRMARFYVLDDRQYRTYQACPRPEHGGSNVVEKCEALVDENRSMLGLEQEAWLSGRLRQSSARWNIIAQQTLMARLDRDPGPARKFWTDGWDGYPAARQRLIDELVAHKVSNPLVIGGDMHTYWVCDILNDFDDPYSPVVATEVCSTSITSLGPRQRRVDRWRTGAPHVKYANSRRRGYTLVQLYPHAAHLDLRAVEDTADPDSGIETIETFTITNGKAGAVRA